MTKSSKVSSLTIRSYYFVNPHNFKSAVSLQQDYLVYLFTVLSILTVMVLNFYRICCLPTSSFFWYWL